MQLAMEGDIPVIVKNLFNPQAPGTEITKTRYARKSVTSIVLRSNTVMLNIESNTKMLNTHDFRSRCFSAFENLDIFVDSVANSDGKISLIVVPSKLSSHEFFQLKLDNVIKELKKFAVVHQLGDRSIISLIGNNTQMSSPILVKAISALWSINVEVQKFWHGASEAMKVSLVVSDTETKSCLQALHSEFCEKGFVSEDQGADREVHDSPGQVPENSPAAAASSGDKRKADNHIHPEATSDVHQRQRTNTDSMAFSDDRASKPAELFEDNGGKLNCVMDVGAPHVDPEQPSVVDEYPVGVNNGFGIEVRPEQHVPTDKHGLSVDGYLAPPNGVDNCYGTEVDNLHGVAFEVQPEQQQQQQVLHEVGQGSGGSPGVLQDETKYPHNSLTDSALEDIRRRILKDDDYGISAVCGTDLGWEETEPQSFGYNGTIRGYSDRAFNDFFDSIGDTNIEPVRVDAGTGLIEEATHIALTDIKRNLFSEEELMQEGDGNGGDPGGYLAGIQLECNRNLDDPVIQYTPGATTEEDVGQGWSGRFDGELFPLPDWGNR